jgi:hypothetical protein
MYWLTRLDGLRTACIVSATLLSIFAVVCIMAIAVRAGDSSDKPAEYLAPKAKWSIPLAIALIIAAILTPNTKEYAAIKFIPMIATENVQEDAGELYGLTVEWMKAQLREGEE